MVRLDSPKLLNVVDTLADVVTAVREGRATMWQGPGGWVVEYDKDGTSVTLQLLELP